jgi:hypothetical protein
MPSITFITSTSTANSVIKGTNRIFDLKTRATNAIRLNVEQCDARPSSLLQPLVSCIPLRYKDHLDYKITRVIGSFNSFEREFYDMMRSCFLKCPFPPVATTSY